MLFVLFSPGADPLAGAGPGAAQGASNGLPPHLPPPSHALSPGHTLMLAREQERMCELISRSGYAPDPLMAQQVSRTQLNVIILYEVGME